MIYSITNFNCQECVYSQIEIKLDLFTSAVSDVVNDILIYIFGIFWATSDVGHLVQCFKSLHTIYLK